MTLTVSDLDREIELPADRSAPGADTAAWRDALAPYAQARWGRGLLGIATSLLPYLGLSVLMYIMLEDSVLLALALSIPTAGFLARTFIMFHDCTHGSLLPSRRGNRWFGAVLGAFVLAPFRRWRHDHAVHHASSGDLHRRGVGDIPMLTVAEYQSRSWRGRVAYRLFRNPVVMFGLGPVFAMMIGPRIATRAQRPRLRRSVLGTDLALAVVIGALCWLIGWQDFLLVWGPAALITGAVGIWLFYVQHQFEDVCWQSGEQWTFVDAALSGSSYLKLPPPLQFFTGNIGLHHVHHLNARIPNYNLQRAHDKTGLFRDVPVLTLRDGLRAVRLKLWDEQQGRLVTFAQSHKRPAPTPSTQVPVTGP
jgi:acyl-lipid omega-6 desaturase (Delta-12 desaturase)